MLWKCCTQYAIKFGKLSSGHRTGKGPFSFQSQRKAMPNIVEITTQLHSSHTLAKKCGKFFKSWEYQTTWPASWEICMQVRKQQLELDMEQQIVPKLGRVLQGYMFSPCLFNLYAKYIMRNAGLDEAQVGNKFARRNINNIRYSDDTTLMAESEGVKSL